MTYRSVAVRARAGAAWLFPLLGLTIPISTAADGVLLALIVLFWLAALRFDFAEWSGYFTAIKPLAVAAALFTLLVAGTLYSGVPFREGWSMASKYSDLFLISVLLWAAAYARVKRLGLYAFLLAIGLNLILSYAVSNGFIDFIPGLRMAPWYPIGFKMSVTHSLFVSYGAFLCLLFAREAKTTAVRTLLIGLAALCAHNVLFIVIGRTGYVVLAALLIYLVVTAMRTARTRVIAALLAASLFAVAFYVPSAFQERLHLVVTELAQWKRGAEDGTSVGQRVGYYLTTLEIVAEHPIAGVGTGGFAKAYAEKVKGTQAPATGNPHNDYLLIAAQVGLPGLALLILLYVLLWRDADTLGSILERDLMRGLVLTMAIGGLFNSLLLDHAEGLLFAWATALLYARHRERRAGDGRRRVSNAGTFAA